VEQAQHESRGKLYDGVASRIGHRLQQLKIQVDRLAIEQAMQLQNHPVRSLDQTAGILHQLDWESFGMGSYLSTEDDSSLRQESEIPPRLDGTYSEEPTSSLGQETQIQPKLNYTYLKVGLSYGDGIMSRIRGYMDPTELMGFAARGLFMNLRPKEFSASCREVGPLKAWKQFLEDNVFRQWNYC
jgi:monolysocardiolipin acyltransferase